MTRFEKPNMLMNQTHASEGAYADAYVYTQHAEATTLTRVNNVTNMCCTGVCICPPCPNVCA